MCVHVCSQSFHHSAVLQLDTLCLLLSIVPACKGVPMYREEHTARAHTQDLLFQEPRFPAGGRGPSNIPCREPDCWAHSFPTTTAQSPKYPKTGLSDPPNSQPGRSPTKSCQHHFKPKQVLQVEKIELIIGLWGKMTVEDQ